MSDPAAALERSVRAAAAYAAELAAELADGLADGLTDDSDELRRVRELVRWQQIAVDDLRARLADSVRAVDTRLRRAAYAERFGAAGWPARRAALLAGSDPVRAYLAAWVEALLAGRYDEADRLASVPLPGPWAWLPERVAEATAGVRDRSAARFEPAGRFLSAGAVVEGVPALSAGRRAAVDVLRARLLAFGAGDADGALALLAGVPGPDAAAVRAALDPALPVPDAGDLAAVVETVRRLADDDPEQALAGAQQAIGGLADLTGLAGRLDVLIQPPPAEVWVAAADRALADGDRDGAAALLDRAWAPNLVLEAEVAALRARLDPTPDSLVEAGRAAVWAGRTTASVAAYEQALAAAPGHEAARFGLADALLVSTNELPLSQARPVLERVLTLLDVRELTPDNAWTLQVEAGACGRLAGAADPRRVGWLWRGLDAAARAVAFAPDRAAAWVSLAAALGGLQRWRAAEVTSRYGFLLGPGERPVQEARLIGLANAGRMDEVRALLADLGVVDDPPEPVDARLAWLHAIEAYAREDQGDRAGALRHALIATRSGPDVLLYRRLAGTACLLTGDPAGAVEHWRVVWREARDDEWEGLSMAAWAALHQGLHDAAIELAERLRPVERAGLDEGDAAAVLGAARLLSGRDGLADLRHAVAASSTRRQLDELFRTLPALGVPVDGLARERAAAYARVAERDGRSAADELADPPAGFERTARLAAALCRLAAGDPDGDRDLVTLGSPEAARLWDQAEEIRSVALVGPAPPATEPDAEAPVEDKLRLELPASLFDGVADPVRTHELFLRLLPDARVRSALPAVNVVAEWSVDPDRFRAHLADGVFEGTVAPAGPGPDDPLAAWRYRSPLEAVLRAVADEYARREPGTTPA